MKKLRKGQRRALEKAVKSGITEGFYLAGDEDIAAMKSVAIMQRGSKKDFYDLYFLMNHHGWNLNDVIRFSHEKYGNLFDEGSFLKALIYFEDAEVESYPDMEPLWSRVKVFFIESVRKYIRRI